MISSWNGKCLHAGRTCSSCVIVLAQLVSVASLLADGQAKEILATGDVSHVPLLRREPRQGHQHQLVGDYKPEVMLENNITGCVTRATRADDKGNHIMYLDRHPVQCLDDELLSSWNLIVPRPDKVALEYTCCQAKLTACLDETTHYQTSQLAFMDAGQFSRHNVSCSAGRALKSWALTRLTETRDLVKYSCCRPDGLLRSCLNFQTEPSYIGESYTELTKHNLNCAGSVLTRFQLERLPGHLMRFSYTCCDAALNIPTVTEAPSD